MPRSPFQKIADALRLLWPDAEERAYVRLLRRSPEFDRAYYLGANPRLHLLFRLFPERHYVREGEAMGLCPNPGFSPYAYLIHNPDLAGQGIRPLRHYIESGRAEGRSTLDPARPEPLPAFPAIGPGDRPDPAAPVAIALHLYYPDLWEEFRAILAAQHFGFDLFVTLTGPAAADPGTARSIARAFPQVRTWALPNRGRDLLPFAYLASSGLFSGYAAVCKLHGKASPHRRDGADWRRGLVAGILGDPAATRRRLQGFLDRPDLGLWVADGHLARGAQWWGPNRDRTLALLARGGLAPDPAALVFPAGSIYWLKPAVIDRLAALRLTPADFESERGLVDGTTAHALERGMGYLVLATGLTLCETAALDACTGGAGARDRS